MLKKNLIRPVRIAAAATMLTAVLSGCGSTRTPESAARKIINASYVGSTIEYLSSDSLKGRSTPSKELDSAAAYIQRQFESFGLQPVNGSYFQPLSLTVVELGADNHLVIKDKNDNSQKSFNIKFDFTPFEMTAGRSVGGDIVFAGYGITAPEYGYDDYAGLDVTGKTVIVLKHEPGENDTASVFAGTKPSIHSEISEKVSNAIEHKAAAIIIVTDPLNHTSLSPQGFPWPSLSKFIPKSALPVMIDSPDSMKIPVVQAGEEVVKGLFGSVEALRNIQASIDKNVKPASFIIAGKKIDLKTDLRVARSEIKENPAKNVVGFLEGSDPKLKNELLVIGAHYDHVGYKKSHQPDQDYIFNGADDNASGTSGMIAIAKTFVSMEKRPARSILFIAFAGEELGLFGSQWYVNHPLFPLSNTVAMLNLDMIGRNSKDELFLVGANAEPELTAIAMKENEKTGFKIKFEDDFSGRSDQANFQKKGVPALFFFTGTHADYHKVSDEFSLIDKDKTAEVTRLAFFTAYRIANENMHYKNNK